MRKQMNRILLSSVIALGVGAMGVVAAAQAQPPQRPRPAQERPATREDGLDPSPVDPAKDSKLDLFLNDWRNAKPRTESGALVFHDILTKLDSSDPLQPHKPGAVLTEISSVSYTTLAPGAAASGRMKANEREIFYTVGGSGKIEAGGKSHEVREGVGFTLTPAFDFKLTNTGKTPLAFYVRREDIPASGKADPDLVVVDRFDNDRRIGAHWVHTCNGGPSGMSLCTVAPFTIPQPHSHPGEEAWIMVKGESILSLGKDLVKMHPGQAYKIPPTGVAAHSNLNLQDEPIELIYMGPADRTIDAAQVAERAKATGPANLAAMDYARLDNNPINPAAEPDVDMFMGNWKDAWPRVAHGNLYVRDMLTALPTGGDPLHPARKGAVLTNAEAVSYAMLEPRSSAHRLDGELKDVQETFVVDSGTGSITAGGKTFPLSKGKAFILTPGLDFKLTATGEHYLTFYVVTEKVPAGFTPKASFEVVDNSAKPQTVAAWYDQERPLISKSDGLSQYGAVTQVQLKSMAMSRPYSDGKDVEEIWIATDGDTEMLFGKELRRLTPGTAYRVPSTGITAHANINVAGKPAGFLYMVK
jgi:mannose-6-phosphate isomerase-like protein (cupin superfamily)